MPTLILPTNRASLRDARMRTDFGSHSIIQFKKKTRTNIFYKIRLYLEIKLEFQIHMKFIGESFWLLSTISSLIVQYGKKPDRS